MINNLFDIIFTINSHADWPKNAKIRYAYIELGKLVHKDTWFFYTVKNKLLNDKKSLRYSDDIVEQMLSTDEGFDYSVICKNAANMLGFIFRNTGIKYEMKRSFEPEIYNSDNKTIAVYHYFLVVEGDENKKYFLTLNPDLANIQIGRKTSHFANMIPYRIHRAYTNPDGKIENRLVQYYEGEEIDASYLTDEEIFELDKIIGHNFEYLYGDETPYYTDYFFKLLKDAYEYNKEYYMEIACDTQFFVDVCELANGKTIDELDSDEDKKTIDILNNDVIIEQSLDKVPLEQLEMVKQYVFVSVLQFFKGRFDVEFNIDSYFDLLENRDYDTITRNFKMFFVQNIGVDKLANEYKILDPLRKIEKLRDFLKAIDIVIYDKGNQNYKQACDNFFKYLKIISLIFVDENKFADNKKMPTSEYIAFKLYKSLGKILDVGHITDYNKMGLAEQITLIKELIDIILPDMRADKDTVPLFRHEKSSVENRIFSTVILDKNDPNHAYYFIMVKKLIGDNSSVNGWKSMLYDFKNNTIKFEQPSKILNNYYVIKDDDLKLLIEEMNKPGISR